MVMRIFSFSLIFTLFSLLIPLGGAVWAQDLPTRRIEDDSSLRISLLDSWFKASPGSVLAKRPENYTLRGGSRVQVRIERSSQNREEFAIVLAREQNGAFDDTRRSFPGWAQGSWILTRRRDNNGEGSKIRVFLRSDYNTYIQFRPFNNEKCLFDVVAYDSYLVRSLPLPIPFERLLVMPIEDVLAVAGNRFPRRYFEPEPGVYKDTRDFVTEVRSRLPALKFRDDGAFNEMAIMCLSIPLRCRTAWRGRPRPE